MTEALFCDGYKTFHKDAMYEEIEYMYGNYINRNDRLSNLPNNSLGGVGFIGMQYLCKTSFIKEWNETFFNVDKETVLKQIKRILDNYLDTDYDVSHYARLHDVGYLPVEIKALREGTVVPYGVAPFTIKSTLPGFRWLAIYLETIISTELWGMCTTFTTAAFYIKQTREMFIEAGLPLDMVPFMNHDFSMRGMFGKIAGAMSAFCHAAAGNYGSDSIPAIMFAEKYYGADIEKEIIIKSVKATEHSVVTSFIHAYSKKHGVSLFAAEVAYVRMLLLKNPTGVLSHVSDSIDFWKFVTEGLPLLKEEIMARDGVFVVRPDSGTPEDILCGDESSDAPAVKKGLIEILADIFGTTENNFGVKSLDPHIGSIYGDSINPVRQKEIGDRLLNKNFSPAVVLGNGSYGYQMVTRDTHGTAIKCTAAILKDGTLVDVYKDPKTDSKKKSAKGLLRLEIEGGEIVQYEQQTIEQEKQGILEPVFVNGKLVRECTLQDIRSNISNHLDNVLYQAATE